MAQGAVLLAEGNAVLVVVGAVHDHTADVDELFQQFEVLRVARLTIKFCYRHVVRWADGVASQLLGSTLAKIIEKISRFDAAVEECRFASGPFMDNACHNKVTKVVGLEVEAVLESRIVLRASGGADWAISPVGKAEGHSGGVSLLDDDGGMDIAIGALRFLDETDETVHDGVELSTVCHGIDRGNGFQPFVHVAVVEWRTVMLALRLACCHKEIVKALSFLRLPRLPHALHAGLAQHIETLAPKTVGPLH